MAASSYPDAKVIEMSRNFVNVVAHRETSHGDKEVVIGREKVKLCQEYYTIPCDVHVKGCDAINKFFSGNMGLPTTVFCDPTGKEISRETGSLGAGALVKKMQEVLGKVSGEKIHYTLWKQASQSISDGDALLEKGEHKKAIEAYSKVSKMKGKALQQLATDALAKASEIGEKLLGEALAIEDVAEKKKALKRIADDFKPLEVAVKAKKELDALK